MPQATESESRKAAWGIEVGDCRTVLSRFVQQNGAIIDAVVTDPPYGLGFMARDWDYEVPGPDYWKIIKQAVKPGAHLLAFGGARTHHRLMSAIEDAGWELRDTVNWLYGSGFPKSHNVSKELGTALKPAWEPIVLARNPFKGTVEKNVVAYGTGCLNIDASRIGGAEGRWPANLLLDEVSAEMLDAQTGILSSGDVRTDYKKYPRVEAGSFALGTKMRVLGPDSVYNDSGGASRFFYCAKSSRSEREAGLDHLPGRNVNDGRETSIDNPYQRGDTVRKNTHPTVKPLDLMRWLVRLVTPMGGLVLDPFQGSGTTGIACVHEGFDYFGIDNDPECFTIAEARIEHAQKVSHQESLRSRQALHHQGNGARARGRNDRAVDPPR